MKDRKKTTQRKKEKKMKYMYTLLFIDYMDLYCGETINVGAHHQIRLKLTSSSAYDSNMHCEVTLKTDWSRRMMFFFKAMNIEQSDNCQDDFLEIDDGSSRSDPYITGNEITGWTSTGTDHIYGSLTKNN